jgi:dihydrofolate reductase
VIVSLIAAMDRTRAIGIDKRLPWRLSADLRRFRELTMGHHIIVGRKTFESIGRALPGRRTIIVTRNENYQSPADSENLSIVHSVEEAIELARERDETELFVCGGAEIYAQTIGLADRLYLTFVETEAAADVFFPEWDESEWEVRESVFHSADEKNQFPFLFKSLYRKRGDLTQSR